jgi:hypothetical protein
VIGWALANPGYAFFLVIFALCAVVAVVSALVEPFRLRARTRLVNAERDRLDPDELQPPKR